MVLWRLRYKLSLRDVAEMFLERGFIFTHETVRDGEKRFAPLMADQLRTKRRGQAGTSCYVDETYRHAFMESGAISIVPLITMATWLIRDSARGEIWMQPKRSSSKPLQWLVIRQRLSQQTGIAPIPVPSARPWAHEVAHRTNVYLNNRREQDHRGMKQRYYPMRGFGNVASAARFCRAFDELRHYFRYRSTTREIMSLAQQRRIFCERLAVLQKLMGAVA